ncbi:hypothetical protein [Desulfitobacterium sp. AusDCA]|uniref:hypothetical protein n=1 Tax=Desulfitobacterium sp. AusDCA TaxID=3240383 RepID=UPI003DA7476B
MNNDELLQNVVQTRNILIKLDGMQNKRNRARIAGQNSENLKISKWWLVLAIIASYALSGIHYLVGWIAFFVLICAFIYLRKMNKRLLKKPELNIENIDQEYNQNFEELNTSIIPQDYRNLYSLNKIEGYLRNNRADTLRDCINLLEEDKKHEEQIENLKRIQDQNDELYQLALQNNIDQEQEQNMQG